MSSDVAADLPTKLKNAEIEIEKLTEDNDLLAQEVNLLKPG